MHRDEALKFSQLAAFTVAKGSHAFFSFNPHNYLKKVYYNFHFIDKKIETQEMAEQRLDSGLPDGKYHSLNHCTLLPNCFP